MDFIVGLIVFSILIGVVVTVHELGHFIVAKHFNVFCGEFAIGMGPIIYKKQKNETLYTVRALPLGGFVSMAGESDDTMKSVEVPHERTVNGLKTWQKICVMSAGIVMNILLAWLIFIGLTMYQGKVIDNKIPVFDTIVENSVADKAGFEEGDIVVSLTGEDGKKIKLEGFNDFRTEINLNPQTWIFEVKRGDEYLNLTATPEFDRENNVYLMGVTSKAEFKDIKWYEAFRYGTESMIDNSTLLFRSLGQLIQGKNLDQLSGPIGIYKVTKKAFDIDLTVYIELFAVFSLNLGVMNAIPIPALDGGRVVISLIEKAIGRPLSEKVMNGLIMVGFIMLMGLMLFATWNDISKLF